MRAGVFLQSYATRYDVSLAVINVWQRNQILDPLLSSCVTSVAHISIQEMSKVGSSKWILDLVSEHFAHIHVFRIQTVRFLFAYLTGTPFHEAFLTLDVDDYESNLYRRMGQLHAARHDEPRAQMFLSRSKRFEQLEMEAMALFHHVYISNPRERHSIEQKYKPRDIFVIPNAIQISSSPQLETTKSPVTFLFVGTLDYFPNEDGILWFCETILPIIRAASAITFRVIIVGSHPREVVRRLHNGIDVLLYSDVPEVRTFYHQSHVCIVPIRAASGTRIKILEALSEGRPVVTTTLGAEGLDVSNGRELLVADSTEDFADRCQELLENPALRRRLSAEGFQWVKANHSIERVSEAILSIDPVLS